MNQPPSPPKKKGLSTVLIVVGVLLVVALGTCGASAVWLGHRVKEVKQDIADGGIVLVSPPEVQAALAGAKKDYVGSWTSASGKSTLDIRSDGSLKLVQAETDFRESVEGPIAAFSGDDIELRLALKFTIHVSVPPHRAGDRWEMTARHITFVRQ